MREVRRGGIYFVDLGFGEGSEIGKIRPCVVVQNDIGNTYSPTTIILPITHRNKNLKQPTQVFIESHMLEGKGSINGVIMGEQIRTINKTRIRSYSGKSLTASAMIFLDNAIKSSMGILN